MGGFRARRGSNPRLSYPKLEGSGPILRANRAPDRENVAICGSNLHWFSTYGGRAVTGRPGRYPAFIASCQVELSSVGPGAASGRRANDCRKRAPDYRVAARDGIAAS